MQFSHPTEYFQKINQVFNWILAGPLAYFAFLFFAQQTSNGQGWEGLIKDKFYQDLLLYTLLPLCIMLGIYSYRNFREVNKSIDSSESLKEKLDQFYQNFFRFQMILSISGGLSLIGLHITGKELFLGIYIILLFMASIQRPTPQSIQKSIRLNKEELEILVKKYPFPE